jgi:hypothetical protein
MRALISLGLSAGFMASVCAGDGLSYTLLRNETVGDTSRIVIATFNANETQDFNRDNCEHARELFQVEPTNHARYWCEKGSVRK